MLTEVEKRIIQALQCDLPVEGQPFLRLAASLGLDEATVLTAVRKLMEEGYIRRFGATIRHRISGFAANPMVAWAVPAAAIDRVGRLFAARREVTHCYERRTTGDWPYNLFTMIHGRTPEDCRALAADMAREAGISDYAMLFSERELKKTTMRYVLDVEEAAADSASP